MLNSAIKKKLLANGSNLTKKKSMENLSQHDETIGTLNSIRREAFFISDYGVELVASQLTLIEWVCK